MRFKLTPRFILFAVLCACLTSGELWLKNAPASNTGRIVFTSLRDGNAEIYVMNADGKNQKRLTDNPAVDFQPSWSPDGKKIAFTSYRNGGNIQIFVMDSDGQNPTRLTDEVWDVHPDWSPDGKKKLHLPVLEMWDCAVKHGIGISTSWTRTERTASG